MSKLISSIALLFAIITFFANVIRETSYFSSVIRAAIVFIGVLFIFFIAAHLLRWGLFIFTARGRT